MTALALAAPVARMTIAHHSKSFALASKLLGPRLRDQTAVVYTWCRRADDAIDDGVDPTALPVLHTELAHAYGGLATDPVLVAFGDVARERGIPQRYPEALLAGMAMDVAAVRYQTHEQLIEYAWRVAGVVGLMMTHVFGVSDEDALIPAAHLGIAMQLTNICRDVAEDWQRGRLYIPDELLAQHGAAGLAGDLERPLPASAVAPIALALRDLLALAERYYRSADRGISALPWRAAIAVRVARDVYAAIGGQIARQDHDVTAGRAHVPRAKKLALVGAAVARIAITSPARLFAKHAAVPHRTLELSDVALS
ncbi:MAG: phytoene/squalene synthase family protein [Myxococcota bacterium]|nr:phytoene/squalene synthase family protein [Myxococcota bacterium]